MKLKIKKKIVLMNIAILIPVIIVICYSIIQNMYYNIVEHTINILKNESYKSQIYIINYLHKQKDADVDFIFKNMSPFLASYLSNNLKLRVQLYDNNKNLVGDSEDLKKTFIDEDVYTALKGKKSYILRKSNNNRFVFLSSPIYLDGKIIGCVRYIYDMNNEFKVVYDTCINMVITGLIAVIAALCLSFYYSDKIVKPILSLKKASNKVANGNFTQVIEINSNDEIQDLAETFNVMSKSLDTYIKNLKNEKQKQKQFLDNVTHELKTPITAIIGYSDLISRVKNEKDVEECAYYINKEGKRLLSLVEELLNLSRIGKDETNMNITKTDINQIVINCINILKPRIDKFSISINNYVSSNFIMADKDKSEEVVLNILDNCIKHSDCNKISVLTNIEKGYVNLIILDDGCGISKNHIDNIFRPFYRVNKNNAREKGSNGLGLSICRTIMNRQNGNIFIESELNKGTKVTLKFKRNIYSFHS